MTDTTENPETTEDLTAKLAKMLKAADDTGGEQPEAVQPDQPEADSSEAQPDIPKRVTRSRIKAAKDDEPKPLGKDEYEVTLPRFPFKKGDEETVAVRFTKPKKWAVAASDRNARWMHVIDTDTAGTETLCTIKTASWLGVKMHDPAIVPVTCPWCLARMIECGLVNQQDNDALIVAWKESKKPPKKAKAPKADATPKADAAPRADAPKADADEKPKVDVTPDPKPSQKPKAPAKPKAPKAPRKRSTTRSTPKVA